MILFLGIYANKSSEFKTTFLLKNMCWPSKNKSMIRNRPVGCQFVVYEITGQMCKYVCIMVFVTSTLQLKNIGNYLTIEGEAKKKNEKKSESISIPCSVMRSIKPMMILIYIY